MTSFNFQKRQTKEQTLDKWRFTNCRHFVGPNLKTELPFLQINRNSYEIVYNIDLNFMLIGYYVFVNVQNQIFCFFECSGNPTSILNSYLFAVLKQPVREKYALSYITVSSVTQLKQNRVLMCDSC